MATVKTYRVVCDNQHVVTVQADSVTVGTGSEAGMATFSKGGVIVAQFNSYQHFYETTG